MPTKTENPVTQLLINRLEKLPFHTDFLETMDNAIVNPSLIEPDLYLAIKYIREKFKNVEHKVLEELLDFEKEDNQVNSEADFFIPKLGILQETDLLSYGFLLQDYIMSQLMAEIKSLRKELGKDNK